MLRLIGGLHVVVSRTEKKPTVEFGFESEIEGERNN